MIDIGGCDSNNQAFPPDCGDPPVPVSNDTYSGFRGSGYGAVRIGDFGGTADKLVLPFASTDAYFEASDSDGNGSFESLMIMSTNTDFVFIFGQLRRYLGRSGHMETIQFTDGNFSIGGASTSDSVTPRIDALNDASRLGAAKKGELARTARNAISKMRAPYKSP